MENEGLRGCDWPWRDPSACFGHQNQPGASRNPGGLVFFFFFLFFLTHSPLSLPLRSSSASLDCSWVWLARRQLFISCSSCSSRLSLVTRLFSCAHLHSHRVSQDSPEKLWLGYARRTHRFFFINPSPPPPTRECNISQQMLRLVQTGKGKWYRLAANGFGWRGQSVAVHWKSSIKYLLWFVFFSSCFYTLRPRWKLPNLNCTLRYSVQVKSECVPNFN